LSPQYGTGGAHCESAVHCTQAPSAEQNGVDVPAQSPFVAHCTQWESVRLHRGADAGHCASLVQPVPHWKSRPQIGAAVPQSALVRHSTQE
jgi:hypothetical protein